MELTARIYNGQTIDLCKIDVTSVCGGGNSVSIYVDSVGEGFMSCETFSKLALGQNILLTTETKDFPFNGHVHKAVFILELCPKYQTRKPRF